MILMFVSSMRVFMRIFLSVILFFTSMTLFAKDGLFILNTNLFESMVDNDLRKSTFIYTNQHDDLYKQSYYYDPMFGTDEGDKRALSFVRIELDNVKEYEYQEHYYNCNNKIRFVISRNFNSNGDLFNSKISYYEIGDIEFKLDSKLC